MSQLICAGTKFVIARWCYITDVVTVLEELDHDDQTADETCEMMTKLSNVAVICNTGDIDKLKMKILGEAQDAYITLNKPTGNAFWQWTTASDSVWVLERNREKQVVVFIDGIEPL